MKTNWNILSAKLDEISRHGDVGISVQSPTGEVWSRQGDIQFPAASIAKIPIMITVYRMIDQNRLALDNEYVLQNIDKSNGSGVLRHMHTGIVLTLSDLIFLMISRELFIVMIFNCSRNKFFKQRMNFHNSTF